LAVSASPITFGAAGDVITYSYVVSNATNVTVSGPFLISDDIVTNVACPGSPAQLIPGGSVTCAGSHTVTQANLDSGSVVSTATARATDPSGNPLTSPATQTTVTAVVAPEVGTVQVSPTAISEIGSCSGQPDTAQITARGITDPDGNVATVTLNWVIDGSRHGQVSMTHQGQSANARLSFAPDTIEALESPVVVTITVIVTDNDGLSATSAPETLTLVDCPAAGDPIATPRIEPDEDEPANDDGTEDEAEPAPPPDRPSKKRTETGREESAAAETTDAAAHESPTKPEKGNKRGPSQEAAPTAEPEAATGDRPASSRPSKTSKDDEKTEDAVPPSEDAEPDPPRDRSSPTDADACPARTEEPPESAECATLDPTDKARRSSKSG
jgi:hypothetical protein